VLLKQVPDRREYHRIATDFPAFLEGKDIRKEHVTDLSMGGCTLKSEDGLSQGTFLQLLLHPSDMEPPIKVDTAIIRSVRSRSVGLQFLEFPAGEKDRLSRFVHGLLVSQRATHQPGF
jgi:c-di-GMP-binding flagellar brake protein YcgR